MSTIRVDDVAPSGGGTSVPVVNSLPKAWCDWNLSGTAAIQTSQNVGSFTDEGTGQSSQTFINNMITSRYAAAGAYNDQNTRVSPNNDGEVSICVLSSSGYQTMSMNGGASLRDAVINGCLIMGDLA